MNILEKTILFFPPVWQCLSMGVSLYRYMCAWAPLQRRSHTDLTCFEMSSLLPRLTVLEETITGMINGMSSTSRACLGFPSPWVSGLSHEVLLLSGSFTHGPLGPHWGQLLLTPLRVSVFLFSSGALGGPIYRGAPGTLSHWYCSHL